MADIAWLHCAWQGQGARLTSQKATAPPPPLHRLRGLHCSHGLHHMALIAWPSLHGFIVLGRAGCLAPTPRILLHGLHRSHGLDRMAFIAWLHRAWKGEGARLTSQKAAAPAPTPRILVPSCSLHRFLVVIALMAFISWPSSHGLIVLGRARVLS